MYILNGNIKKERELKRSESSEYEIINLIRQLISANETILGNFRPIVCNPVFQKWNLFFLLAKKSKAMK